MFREMGAFFHAHPILGTLSVLTVADAVKRAVTGSGIIPTSSKTTAQVGSGAAPGMIPGGG